MIFPFYSPHYIIKQKKVVKQYFAISKLYFDFYKIFLPKILNFIDNLPDFGYNEDTMKIIPIALRNPEIKSKANAKFNSKTLLAMFMG